MLDIHKSIWIDSSSFYIAIITYEKGFHWGIHGVHTYYDGVLGLGLAIEFFRRQLAIVITL